MTPPSKNTSARPDASTLNRLKVYLVSTLKREFDLNHPPPERREEIISQRLDQVYDSTQVNLPDHLREHLYREVLD
jgi:hypothetical protein